MNIGLQPVSRKDESYTWRVFEAAMRDHIDEVWGWDAKWQEKNFKAQMEKCQTFLSNAGLKG